MAKRIIRRKRTGPTFIQRSRSVSSEQKAIWHHVTGAGRSQVKREFFNVNEADETAIGTGLERLIAARIGADQS